MADLSQIKLPNNAVYDLKDSTARSSLANKANTSDLASIAFDGEVGNLNQTDGTVLVFNCGTSTTTV